MLRQQLRYNIFELWKGYVPGGAAGLQIRLALYSSAEWVRPPLSSATVPLLAIVAALSAGFFALKCHRQRPGPGSNP